MLQGLSSKALHTPLRVLRPYGVAVFVNMSRLKSGSIGFASGTMLSVLI